MKTWIHKEGEWKIFLGILIMLLVTTYLTGFFFGARCTGFAYTIKRLPVLLLNLPLIFWAVAVALSVAGLCRSTPAAYDSSKLDFSIRPCALKQKFSWWQITLTALGKILGVVVVAGGLYKLGATYGEVLAPTEFPLFSPAIESFLASAIILALIGFMAILFLLWSRYTLEEGMTRIKGEILFRGATVTLYPFFSYSIPVLEEGGNISVLET